MSLHMQAQLRHAQLNLLCHAWVRWHLGRVTTYSSLSLTHSLTHALSTAVAAAAEFAILLLIAVLEIVLLLLPEEHTGLSFKQREAWSV